MQKEDNLIGQLHKEDWILKKTSFATAPIFRALRVWLKRTNLSYLYEVKIASNRVLSKSTKHFSSVLNITLLLNAVYWIHPVLLFDKTRNNLLSEIAVFTLRYTSP